MREVCRRIATVAPALPQRAEKRRFTDCVREHIDARLALQPQPFANQRSAALGRLRAFAGGFPRRAHGVIRIEVVAGAVAIAMHGRAVALPDFFVDLPIQLAAQGHFVDLQQCCAAVGRRSDFARVELVEWVERGFQGLQRRVQLAEECRRVLRTQALAMLAPEQAAVALSQRRYAIGHRAYQRRLLRVFHVEDRPHMQYAGVDMAEHAVLQTVAVEQVAQFGDVFGQMLRRHGGVFNERLRAGFTGDVAEQAHRPFAHAIDLVHRCLTNRQRMPQALHGAVVLQMFEERFDAALQIFGIVTAELDQIDAQSRPLSVFRKIFGNAVPNDVLHRQQQDLGVDGFNRQRLERHQRPRITQGIHEPGVADVDQHRVLGNRQYVQPRFDDEAQRALSATQHAVEVEALVGLTQMRQVITGQAAVEIGKACLDQLALFINDLPRTTIDFADAIIAGALRCKLILGQRQAVQTLAAAQDHLKLQHMVAGFAVGATALATGVGVDHAADRGAVRGRQFRGKKQPGGLQRGVELVLDHTGLHPHPALFNVDFQNAIHVPRQVDDDAVRQRLTVGAGATASRGDHHFLVRRFGNQPRHPCHIVRIQRKHRRLRQALIDRVVGRKHHAAGVISADFPAKTAVFQGGEKLLVIAGQGFGGRQLGNHRSGHLGQIGLCGGEQLCARNDCVRLRHLIAPMFIAGQPWNKRNFDPLSMSFTNESAHPHTVHVAAAGFRGRRSTRELHPRRP